MSRKRLLIIVLAILALLHLYIGVRLVPDLPAQPVGMLLGALYLLLSLILIPLGFVSRRFLPAFLVQRISWPSLMAIGFGSSLLVLTLLRDMALLVGNALLSDASFTCLAESTAPLVVVAALILTLLGLFNARRLARVKKVDIAIAGLPEGLHNFTIAQISDIHVGPTIKGDYLDAIVQAVNRLSPDVVAITGDLVDGSVKELAPHVQPLARLTSKQGVYFVTGNHEYYSGVRGWLQELPRLGVQVLMNEHRILLHRGEKLLLAGVADYSAHVFEPSHRSDPAKALKGAPRDAAVKVLLAHQPRSCHAAAQAGFDLQLSGHTHGGQFLPWNFFVRLQQPFTAGLHRIGQLQLYISRGTGYWGPPKRLGAPSEITLIRLVPGENLEAGTLS